MGLDQCIAATWGTYQAGQALTARHLTYILQTFLWCCCFFSRKRRGKERKGAKCLITSVQKFWSPMPAQKVPTLSNVSIYAPVLFGRALGLCKGRTPMRYAGVIWLLFLIGRTLIHFKLRSITLCGNQSARDITGFCSVNMDV